MSDHKIVCVSKGAAPHHHVTSIGVQSLYQKWSVAQVRASIAQGNRFYAVGPTSGKTAFVRTYDCTCGARTIRSEPDAVADNNLDNLTACPV